MGLHDLEGRTLVFSKSIRIFAKKIKLNIINEDDCRQLIRSSGSIGANYIEANESLSKKDFLFRIKIARKEAKESAYWLQCLEGNIQKILEPERARLNKEAKELLLILSAIIKKVSNK